ncbi:MAG: hypothetical protein A2Y06_00530 [Omnitrophica WOR_2 bacterium GWA2_37_7]|nr:MAG: hypothetical protein A2Y06_00530 [Omnitrophica WOR_2 bacterium GWA2_37_7]HBG61764.1 hypothetical protein [Candidatus Omnitrophota bacterium]
MAIFRRILFYLFVLIYIIGCPLTIMYILGRVINPETQKVVGKGLIYISNLPPSTTIYINNVIQTEQTPTIIRGLPEGNYTIKLFNEKYLPYEKTVHVEEKKAIALTRILPVPKEWKKDFLSKLPFDDLIPIEDTAFVLARRGPLVKDLFIFKLSESFQQSLHADAIIPSKVSSFRPLLNNDSIYSKAKVLKIFTVKGSNICILKISADKNTLFLWINPKNSDSIIADITALFPDEPDQILWDPDEDKIFFSLQDNHINRLNIQDKALYPKIINNVRSFKVKNKEIYTLLQDSALRKWDYKGVEQDSHLNNASIQPLTDSKEDITPSVKIKDTVLFLDHNGKLLINHSPFEIPVQNIKGFDFEEKDKKLLFWTKNKIGSLDIFSSKAVDALANKRAASINWLVNGKNNITQAFWAYKGSHILYADSDNIYLTEADIFDKPGEVEITSIKKNSHIYYSDITGKCYYLEPKTLKLVSLEIIPPHSIIPQSVSEDINKLEGK